MLLKLFSLNFQFSNGLISFNDEHPLNIYEKLVPFDTFQFSNGLISFNDEHPLNISDTIKGYHRRHKELTDGLGSHWAVG